MGWNGGNAAVIKIAFVCVCVLKSRKVIVQSAVVAKRGNAVCECVVLFFFFFLSGDLFLENAGAAPGGHFSSNKGI